MTLSPILSAPDATTIALDFGVFIAERARTYRVSQSAILSAIQPFMPSQPVPHTLADVPAWPTAGLTDGETATQPTSPSVEPSPEPQPLQPAVQAVAAQEPVVTSPVESDAAAISTPTPVTDQPGEVSASPAPRRNTNRSRVRECHEAHPDWTAPEIAAELGMGTQQVRVVAIHIGLNLPKAAQGRPVEGRKRGEPSIKQQVAEVYAQHPDWTASQIAEHIGAKRNTVTTLLFDARAADREAAPAQPAPAPTPQTPVGLPPARSGTLTQRVRLMYQQHPNWTARMIAHDLGASPSSVQTILGMVRGEAKQQASNDVQFEGRAALVSHYSEVSKRLGKPA